MDKYVDEVKGTMKQFKTGLASDTNVENMVSCVTNKYLQKFADEGKQDTSNHMF